jgi:LAO/AO transport system kinase
VVNKADKPGADAAVRDLENMLAIGAVTRAKVDDGAAAHDGTGHHAGHGAAHGPRAAHASGGVGEDDIWTPPVLRTIAPKGEGVDALLQALASHRAWQSTPAGRENANARARRLLAVALRDAVTEAVEDELGAALADAEGKVARREMDAASAVDALLARFRGVTA